jgi:hypothetical protein
VGTTSSPIGRRTGEGRPPDPDSVFDIDREMATIARHTGTPYISLVDALCRGHHCRLWAKPGQPLQFDYGHLTSGGSAVVVDLIMPDIVAAMIPPNGR